MYIILLEITQNLAKLDQNVVQHDVLSKNLCLSFFKCLRIMCVCVCMRVIGYPASSTVPYTDFSYFSTHR